LETNTKLTDDGAGGWAIRSLFIRVAIVPLWE